MSDYSSRFRTEILPLKDKLFRLALRITLNRQEAEDVVQDALIKVWNIRDRWDTIESIEAFALTVTRNLSLDHTKRVGNSEASLDQEKNDPPDVADNPSERMIQKERQTLVHKLINALPEKQRSCIQLRDIEGKSYKDIANILNITEEQVKVCIFRGRQALRQRFVQMKEGSK